MATETEQARESRDTRSSAATGANGTPIPRQGALQALSISGVVVNKADLIAALSIYVPQLTNVRTLDGDRFVLDFAPQSKER